MELTRPPVMRVAAASKNLCLGWSMRRFVRAEADVRGPNYPAGIRPLTELRSLIISEQAWVKRFNLQNKSQSRNTAHENRSKEGRYLTGLREAGRWSKML
jgi:hypothetical protein